MYKKALLFQLNIFAITFITSWSCNQSHERYINIIGQNLDTLVFFDNSHKGLLTFDQAKTCADLLKDEKYIKWEIPTIEELNLLYKSAKNISKNTFWSSSIDSRYQNLTAGPGSPSNTREEISIKTIDFKTGENKLELYFVHASVAFSGFKKKYDTSSHHAIFVHRNKRGATQENINSISYVSDTLILGDAIPPSGISDDNSESYNKEADSFFNANFFNFLDLNRIKLPKKSVAYSIYGKTSREPKHILILNTNNEWEYWNQLGYGEPKNQYYYDRKSQMKNRDTILCVETNYDVQFYQKTNKFYKLLKEDDNFYYISSREYIYYKSYNHKNDPTSEDIQNADILGPESTDEEGFRVFENDDESNPILKELGVAELCFKLPKRNGTILSIDFNLVPATDGTFVTDNSKKTWVATYEFAKRINN